MHITNRQAEIDKEKENELKEYEEEIKNKDFVQIPILMEANQLRPSSLCLFLALVEITFNEPHPSMTETAYCVVGLDELVIHTKLSKKTVISSTKELIEKKWIKVYKNKSYNCYAINPAKAWGSKANRKWKALYNRDGETTGFTVRGNIVINTDSGEII